MQRRRRLLDTNLPTIRHIVPVTAWFHYVDFTGTWPTAINIELRHHPQSRPKPIARRQFGANFDATITEGKTINAAEAGTLYRRSDVICATLERTIGGTTANSGNYVVSESLYVLRKSIENGSNVYLACVRLQLVKLGTTFAVNVGSIVSLPCLVNELRTLSVYHWNSPFCKHIFVQS